MYDLQQLINSIIILRVSIRWKAKKAESHLSKRIRLGHLKSSACLADYEIIISHIANDINSAVYVYIYEEAVYPTLIATIGSERWLVMIGLDGVMETAFPPDDMDKYLRNDGFMYLGLLGDFLI
jgi:hypothetical protein